MPTNAKRRAHPLANPVLIEVIVLVTLLWVTDTPYATYFDGAQFVHFLLGPATVALAIPLYAQFGRLKRMTGPLLVALIAGSLTAALSAVLPRMASVLHALFSSTSRPVHSRRWRWD